MATTNALRKEIEAVHKATAGLAAVQTALAGAGLAMIRTVAAVRAQTLADRRGRTSASSHIERLLELGGPADLAKPDRDFAERPQLWPASLRALYRAKREYIVDGHYRNGYPDDEAALRRQLSGYQADEDAAIGAELSRAQLNTFHLLA